VLSDLKFSGPTPKIGLSAIIRRAAKNSAVCALFEASSPAGAAVSVSNTVHNLEPRSVGTMMRPSSMITITPTAPARPRRR